MPCLVIPANVSLATENYFFSCANWFYGKILLSVICVVRDSNQEPSTFIIVHYRDNI